MPKNIYKNRIKLKFHKKQKQKNDKLKFLTRKNDKKQM
jgi:hypothetical protein